MKITPFCSLGISVFSSASMPRRHRCCCRCWVASVVSESVRPHRRQPTRLPRPRDSAGKSARVGYHCLLRKMALVEVNNGFTVLETGRTRILYLWWSLGSNGVRVCMFLLLMPCSKSCICILDFWFTPTFNIGILEERSRSSELGTIWSTIFPGAMVADEGMNYYFPETV